jgi:molybdenum-dependent DNA-binding transcriptional regulator ModE
MGENVTVHLANMLQSPSFSKLVVFGSIIRGIYDGMSPVLELRHLKTLVALAETGNLSKAGRRLNLSQPAVSHQIRAMEEHYGIELFERKSDPLGLTAAGQLLVELRDEFRAKPGKDHERKGKKRKHGNHDEPAVTHAKVEQRQVDPLRPGDDS